MLVLLAFFGVVAGVGAMIAPTLREQSQELRTQLPRAVDRVEGWIKKRDGQLRGMLTEPGKTKQAPAQTQPSTTGNDVVTRPSPPRQSRSDSPRVAQETTAEAGGGEFSLRQQLGKQLGGVLGLLFPFVSTTLAAVGAFVLVVFIALYLAADPSLYRRGLLRMIPLNKREKATEILDEVSDALNRWLVTRLICMLAIGGLTTVVLMLLRVKAAVALGLIAGLLEFIPIFGPLLSAVPALALAIVDSPQKALWVALAFVLIQQIEGNVINPLLMKKRIDIPPALTIVGVALMGLVFGFPGLLIAEPLLVAMLVIVKRTYVEEVQEDTASD